MARFYGWRSTPQGYSHFEEAVYFLPFSLLFTNLLTMKSDVIISSPGVFNRPDLYSRRRWRRVQDIAGEFWSRWQKEFIQSLQTWQKWNISKRNFQVGNVILLMEDIGRNKWPMARIVSTEPDSQGIMRIVQLKVTDTSNNNIKLIRRPISKIVLLVENKHGSIPNDGSHVVWVSSWNTTWGEPDVVVQCRSGVILIYEL